MHTASFQRYKNEQTNSKVNSFQNSSVTLIPAISYLAMYYVELLTLTVYTELHYVPVTAVHCTAIIVI